MFVLRVDLALRHPTGSIRLGWHCMVLKAGTYSALIWLTKFFNASFQTKKSLFFFFPLIVPKKHLFTSINFSSLLSCPCYEHPGLCHCFFPFTFASDLLDVLLPFSETPSSGILFLNPCFSSHTTGLYIKSIYLTDLKKTRGLEATLLLRISDLEPPFLILLTSQLRIMFAQSLQYRSVY